MALYLGSKKVSAVIGEKPTATLNIRENGSYDVEGVKTAIVNVQGSAPTDAFEVMRLTQTIEGQFCTIDLDTITPQKGNYYAVPTEAEGNTQIIDIFKFMLIGQERNYGNRFHKKSY